MYWTFNCFLGCIYTVYCIVYIVVLVLNWLSNLEFWLPKKEDQVARIGVMGGGGFRGFGQCPKENVFLPLTPSLIEHCLYGKGSKKWKKILMNFLLGVSPLIELFFLLFSILKINWQVSLVRKKRLITGKTGCPPIGNCRIPPLSAKGFLAKWLSRVPRFC